MLTKKHVLLAGAAMAAIAPLTSKAATVTFGYDQTVTFASNAAFTTGVGTANIVGNSVNIPVGDFFAFNINATVTNNANASNPDPGSGLAQPANLGLAGVGFAFTDSNVTSVVPRVTGGATSYTTTGGPNSNFTISSTGAADTTTGSNGTVLSPISGGVNPGNDVKFNSNAAGFAHATIGAASTADIFTGIIYRVQTTAVSGSSAILAPANPAGSLAVVAVKNPGQAPNANSTGTSDVTYTSHTLGAGDTVNALPALTVVAGVPITGGGPVISLTSTAAGGVSAAAFVGTSNPGTTGINPVGTPTAGYVRGELNAITGGKTGSTEIRFQGPALGGATNDPGTEYIGLNLADTGAFATDQSKLIADINAVTGFTAISSAGSLSAAQQSALNALNGNHGAGFYDILISHASVNGGDNFLGLDLSQDSSLATLSVTDIAAVPEPASVMGLLVGASGLLMGRRKRKA